MDRNGSLSLVFGFAGILLIPSLPAWSTMNFEIGRDYGVGMQAAFITEGDLNGDGNLDLAVANQSDNSITVLINSGKGVFTLKEVPLAAGKKNPVALAIGDLDGDGRNDMVAANVQTIQSGVIPFSEGGLILFFAKEDGTYDQVALSDRGIPSYITITDMDGDKKNDIVSGNLGELSFDLLSGGISQIDTGIEIYTNRGGRNFSNPKTVDIPGSVIQVIAGDFDKDGTQDVLGVVQGTPTYSGILLQLALQDPNITLFKGATGGPTPGDTAGLSHVPWSADIADFDGDGQPDMAVALTGDSDPSNALSFLGRNASIEIYRHTDNGFVSVQSVPVPGIAYWVMAQDFNLDGKIDLAVTTEEVIGSGQNIDMIPHLLIYENQGGNFVLAQTLNMDYNLPRYAVAGDFDKDGDVDIAVMSTIVDATAGFGTNQPVNGNVRVFFNNAKTRVGDWALY